MSTASTDQECAIRSCRSADGTRQWAGIRGPELGRARTANAADDDETHLPFGSRGAGVVLEESAEPRAADDAPLRERQDRRLRRVDVRQRPVAHALVRAFGVEVL